MAKRKDFSSDTVFKEWYERFQQAIDKKFYPQGTGIYIRRKRTANTAIDVVGKIRKVPLESVRLSLSVYHNDEESWPELIRLFENELIQARVYPDSFAEELYSFYMNTAKHIKKNEEIDLFFGLIAFIEDRTFEDQASDEFSVYAAFMDLLLQQMEFLRSDTLDYTHIMAGISTDGQTTLEIPDPLPVIDLPLCKLAMLKREGTRVDTQSFLEREFMKLGHSGIRSLADFQALSAKSMIYIANVNCMAGYINEYTMDMLPKVPLNIVKYTLRAPKLRLSYTENSSKDTVISLGTAMPIDQYLSVLVRHRRRTLPANGVKISFSNSTFYRTLIIKEMFKYGDMVLLYCLSTKSGDMSGRYNIRTNSFLTPLDHVASRPDEFISAIRSLILWAYTAATCDDPFVQTTNDSYHATFVDDSATLEIVSLGNTLRKNDGSEPSQAHQRNLEKYESKEVSLNGFIRKLPQGRSASERAKQLARDIGLELSDGETYVQPFTRNSWVLRKGAKEEQ